MPQNQNLQTQNAPTYNTNSSYGYALAFSLVIILGSIYIGLFGKGLTLWQHLTIQAIFMLFAAFMLTDVLAAYKIFLVQSTIFFVLGITNISSSSFDFVIDSLTPYLLFILIVTIPVALSSKVGLNWNERIKLVLQAAVIPVFFGCLVIIAMLFGPIHDFILTFFSDVFSSSQALIAMYGIRDILMFIITNFWLFFALGVLRSSGGIPSKLAGFAITIIALLTFGMIINAMWQAGIIGSVFINQETLTTDYSSLASSTWNLIKTTGNLSFALYNGTKTDVDTIFKPSFETRVESGSNLRDIGVYIDPPTAVVPNYVQGETFTFLANLRASTHGEAIIVGVGCAIEQNTQKYIGSVEEPSFPVSENHYQTLVCTFPSSITSQLRPGSAQLIVYANYTMTTSGYTRRYFASAQRLTQIRNEGQDPHKVYNIDARSPPSFTTAGPVELSLGTLKALEELSDDPNQQRTYNLFVRLSPQRSVPGQLLNLTSLYFYVPDGFTIPATPNGTPNCVSNVQHIEPDQCMSQCAVGDGSCQADCNQFSTYKLLDGVSVLPYYLRCELEADSTQAVLQNSPIAVKSFRATATYRYYVDQRLSIRIKEGQAGSGTNPQSSFTSLQVLSQYSRTAFDTYEQNKNTYTAKIDQYTIQWGTDATTKRLAQGALLHFWSDSQGDPNFCINGFMTAGFIGLPFSQLVTDQCPQNGGALSTSGEQQIRTVVQGFSALVPGCDSAECVVGKYYCGSAFQYNNYESCNGPFSCTYCHQVLLPNIITYAQSIHADTQG